MNLYLDMASSDLELFSMETAFFYHGLIHAYKSLINNHSHEECKICTTLE